MVQLRVFKHEKAGQECLVRRFPFRIGRAPQNDLSLQASGVWDQHAEIRLRHSDGFLVAALGDGQVTVNDHAIQEKALRNGDVIGLGCLKIHFMLSPTTSRPMRWREIILWVLLGALCLGQVALVYWLPG